MSKQKREHLLFLKDILDSNLPSFKKHIKAVVKTKQKVKKSK